MTSTPASLLERLTTGGDAAAWSRFVDLYTPLMFNWCRGVGLNEADAADFVQDVFVLLVEHFPKFRYDPAQSFRAWLKTVLLNAWRKHQRKLSRAPAHDGNPDLVPDTDPGVIVEEAEHRDYLVRRALAIAKADFEPITWQACWEFVVNDRPAAAVAAELGISVNAVYLAKSRVLRHLRTELAGFLD
ncbi:MAG: sigma-70 family RNA polymerase sigma factor [Planctomycetes bacterium]|nr:sigma-70 family RNA polymerase sigma factor [Planctomycetota bacterium]